MASAATATAAAVKATATAATAAAVDGSTLWSEVVSLVSLDWLTESYIREFRFIPGQTWLSSYYVLAIVPI